MPVPPLSDDEFRLLAYVRGYADRCEQHLDPNWVQEQLEFSVGQMRVAARGLMARGLAEFFEFTPLRGTSRNHWKFGLGAHMCDIRLTQLGWDYLRQKLVE